MKVYCVTARNVKLVRAQRFWFQRGRSAEAHAKTLKDEGWFDIEVKEEDFAPTQEGACSLLNRVAMEE